MSKDLLVDLAIRYGFQVLGALVILGVGAMIAGWLGRVAEPWVRVPDVGPADSELYQALVEQFATRSIPFGTVPTNVRLLNGARTA